VAKGAIFSPFAGKVLPLTERESGTSFKTLEKTDKKAGARSDPLTELLGI